MGTFRQQDARASGVAQWDRPAWRHCLVVPPPRRCRPAKSQSTTGSRVRTSASTRAAAAFFAPRPGDRAGFGCGGDSTLARASFDGLGPILGGVFLGRAMPAAASAPPLCSAAATAASCCDGLGLGPLPTAPAAAAVPAALFVATVAGCATGSGLVGVSADGSGGALTPGAGGSGAGPAAAGLPACCVAPLAGDGVELDCSSTSANF